MGSNVPTTTLSLDSGGICFLYSCSCLSIYGSCAAMSTRLFADKPSIYFRPRYECEKGKVTHKTITFRYATCNNKLNTTHHHLDTILVQGGTFAQQYALWRPHCHSFSCYKDLLLFFEFKDSFFWRNMIAKQVLNHSHEWWHWFSRKGRTKAIVMNFHSTNVLNSMTQQRKR